MRYKRILILVLVFTMMLNFAFVPQKSHAEVISMSYGLYVFIQACYAAGLTYIVADNAISTYEQFSELMLSNGMYPGEPPEDRDYKAMIAGMLGVGVVTPWNDLVDNVKDFFQSIGSKPGENSYLIDNSVQSFMGVTDGSYQYTIKFFESGKSNPNTTYTRTLYVNGYGVVAVYKEGLLTFNWSDGSVSSSNHYVSSFDFYVTVSPDSVSFGTYNYMFGGHSFKLSSSNPSDTSEFSPVVYNINNYSYIISNDPEDKTQISPSIDVIPDDKFETILTDTGEYKQYIGDDLVEDYIKGIETITNPNDLIVSNPGKFVETDYGIVWVPDGSPMPGKPITKPQPEPSPGTFKTLEDGTIVWVPYGKPIPNPNKDPGKFETLTDGTVVWVPDGYPKPNPSLTGYPKPNPNTNPKPDPSPYPDTFPTDPYPEIVEQDVPIPTGLGKIIALLKQLVNWSSRIFNKDKIDEEIGIEKPGLFEIPPDLALDFEPFSNVTLTDKFPFCLPWDLKNSISILVADGEPPKWEVPFLVGRASEKVVIDLKEFEDLAGISRGFFSLLFVIALVIVTRRFIGGA